MYQIQGHGISVTAYDYLAGGIGSVVWDGKEFINNGPDKGRQLQTALQIRDAAGSHAEERNPTECGQLAELHAPTHSKMLRCEIGNGQFSTQCQAAYWKPYRGRATSSTLISKDVAIMPWGLDYQVTIDPEGADEKEMRYFNAEVVTGYMPFEFNQAAFVPKTGKLIHHNLADIDESSPNWMIDAGGLKTYRATNHDFPLVMSTQDGKHAMGALMLKQQALFASQGRIRSVISAFPGAHPKPGVTKWSLAVADRTPDDMYRFHVHIYIGTKQDVVRALRAQM